MTAARARRLFVGLTTLVPLLGGPIGNVRAAADDPSSLRGGASASGPPAVEPGVAARKEPLEPVPADAKPRSINLWPLFQYDSDPAARTSHLRIFGPLLEYRADAERQAFHFRPLLSIDQSRVGHDDHVNLLYLLRSHWGQTEQVTTGFGGIFTYRTRTSADGRTLEAQDVRLLPLYFYRWESPQPKGRLSIAPLYVDLEDVYGYERIEMVLFPAYLRLKTPALDRYYYPYPILSRDGPPGSGYRLWPFPLRDRQGNRVEHTAAAGDPERLTYFPIWRDELEATDSQATGSHPTDPS